MPYYCIFKVNTIQELEIKLEIFRPAALFGRTDGERASNGGFWRPGVRRPGWHGCVAQWPEKLGKVIRWIVCHSRWWSPHSTRIAGSLVRGITSIPTSWILDITMCHLGDHHTEKPITRPRRCRNLWCPTITRTLRPGLPDPPRSSRYIDVNLISVRYFFYNYYDYYYNYNHYCYYYHYYCY